MFPRPTGRFRFQTFAVSSDFPLGRAQHPYEAVRTAADPDAALLGFLQTTYRAAADLGHWDPSLERALGVPGRPRAVEVVGRSMRARPA
jgi:hypothetical protein